MSTQQQWQEVIEHQAGNQEVGSVWPGRWLFEKMAGEFDVHRLMIGGENHGYLFWVKCQGVGIAKGMKELKSVFDELDAEIGKGVGLRVRVTELEARVAELEVSPRPAVARAVRETVVKERSLQVVVKEWVSKGQQAYEGRASGAKWSELGGNAAQQIARKYQRVHGLPWPPEPVVQLPEAPDATRDHH